MQIHVVDSSFGLEKIRFVTIFVFREKVPSTSIVWFFRIIIKDQQGLLGIIWDQIAKLWSKMLIRNYVLQVFTISSGLATILLAFAMFSYADQCR